MGDHLHTGAYQQILQRPKSGARLLALDGVRGLAIAIVLAFHYFSEVINLVNHSSGWNGLRWFWCGVDLFFVLSGFLITGILIDAKVKPHYFRNFYARRSLRIFPAYYAMLIVFLVILPLLGQEGALLERTQIYGPHWAYWLYLINLYNAAHARAAGFLAHCWSLAIEEQFYLFWPALVFVLSARGMFRLCIAAIVGCMTLRFWMLEHGYSVLSAYCLTFTRVDSLAMGAAAALIYKGERGGLRLQKLSYVCLVAGAVMMAALMPLKHRFPQAGVLFEEATKYTWLGLIFAGLIGLAATLPPNAVLQRPLTAKPLTFLGRYSYGLYLYHFPVLLGLRAMPWFAAGRMPLVGLSLFVSLSLAVALVSWNLIERPILKLKIYFESTGPAPDGPAVTPRDWMLRRAASKNSFPSTDFDATLCVEGSCCFEPEAMTAFFGPGMDTFAKDSSNKASPASRHKPVFIELPAPESQPAPTLEGQRETLPPKSAALLEKEPRVPALDGVRGVAVLLVLAFHFMDIGYPKIFGPVGFAIYNFGWTGVDLFFVLSGFLITGILFDAKGLNGYFSSFYGRRAVRIFPPYFLVVALVLYAIPSIWPWLFQKGELAPTGPPWMYWTYLTNYYFAKHNAYGVLGHTWSLCVEEQFYLCWPLVVMLFSRRRLMQICVAIVLVSIPVRAYFLRQNNYDFNNIWEVYLWTFTRVDELAMGAFVSLAARSQRGVVLLKQLRWFAFAAAACVVGLWVFKKHAEHTDSLKAMSYLVENSTKFTFVGLFFAAGLATVITTSPTNLLNRFLHLGWLRWFGRYSYGLYLFHVPLIETVKEYFGRSPKGWVMGEEYLIFIVGSIGLALLSWHGLEKHMLKLKKFFPMPTRRASLAAEPARSKNELPDDLDLATLHVG